MCLFNRERLPGSLPALSVLLVSEFVVVKFRMYPYIVFTVPRIRQSDVGIQGYLNIQCSEEKRGDRESMGLKSDCDRQWNE